MTIFPGVLFWLFPILMFLAASSGCGYDADSTGPGQTNDDLDSVPLGRPAPGLAEVTQIASLPILRYGSIAKQVSSHAKDGSNNDGFTLFTQLYIDDNGEYVIFDDYGPGCIYRFWFSGILSWINKVSIYVDDMETPIVDTWLSLLFMGLVQEPFKSPLTVFAFDSSGGCVNYIPICYAQRAKITLRLPPDFFSISYRRYDIDQGVASFTGEEDYAPAFSQWENTGLDPKPETFVRTTSGSFQVAHSGSETLLSEQGAGAVWSLHLKADPFEFDIISHLWILATWDGHVVPDVEAPLNEFFNSYQINDTRRALLLGRKGEQYYCYLPMPYWSSADISIENRGAQDATVEYEVQILSRAYPDDAAYFTAIRNVEAPTTLGVDYNFAKVKGAGHYVGVTYTMSGPLDGSYMEGDERFYVNGSASPACYGTGTEDYFNGGWHFTFGPFGLPLHGSPFCLVAIDADHSRTGAYRMHLGDLVPFFMSADFGIEHDMNDGDTNDSHSSVAYLYLRSRPLMEETDDFDVGDASSASAHNYAATGFEPTGPMVSYFEGDHDDIRVTEDGNEICTQSEFTMRINPDNVGVVLRRMLDQSYGRQLAKVYVHGKYAGMWYDVFENPILRWAHSDMPLPASLTSGKSEIRIRVENQGKVPWTEYRYEMFSYLKAGLLSR